MGSHTALNIIQHIVICCRFYSCIIFARLLDEEQELRKLTTTFTWLKAISGVFCELSVRGFIVSKNL